MRHLTKKLMALALFAALILFPAAETWAEPRFTDNGDGTVTDNLTDLVWLKDANCFGQKNWNNASAYSLANGQCGLTDGSEAGDWSLPNSHELFSLIDDSQFNPALPSGHPFTGVQAGPYWFRPTSADIEKGARGINMSQGNVFYGYRTSILHVWPVRTGHR
jgi:hypothetical protein